TLALRGATLRPRPRAGWAGWRLVPGVQRLQVNRQHDRRHHVPQPHHKEEPMPMPRAVVVAFLLAAACGVDSELSVSPADDSVGSAAAKLDPAPDYVIEGVSGPPSALTVNDVSMDVTVCNHGGSGSGVLVRGYL